MSFVSGLLMRGDECTRLTISSLSVYRSTATEPLNLEGVQVDLQFTKTNFGDKVDNRVLASHSVIHEDYLVHGALHAWPRLETPLRFADIKSGRWYVIVLFPPPLCLDLECPQGSRNRQHPTFCAGKNCCSQPLSSLWVHWSLRILKRSKKQS